jgi:putative ABC transport system permease protein
VALLIGVEQVRLGARESFANTISQTDLIVGARGGALQLLLYTVFRVGSATNNIAYESYEHFRNHPAEVAEGRVPSEIFDVALGSDVAAELKYRLGDHGVITHGITHGRGLREHDDKPFTVVGILKKTATPVDRSLYITVEGMEAMHLDWSEGAPPMPGEAMQAWRFAKEEIKIKQITAFLLRARSRIDTLHLQREVNTFVDEPLMAIIPGVALSELWHTIGYAEEALRVVSLFVIIIGLLGILVSRYTALSERRGLQSRLHIR